MKALLLTLLIVTAAVPAAAQTGPADKPDSQSLSSEKTPPAAGGGSTAAPTAEPKSGTISDTAKESSRLRDQRRYKPDREARQLGPWIKKDQRVVQEAGPSRGPAFRRRSGCAVLFNSGGIMAMSFRAAHLAVATGASTGIGSNSLNQSAIANITSASVLAPLLPLVSALYRQRTRSEPRLEFISPRGHASPTDRRRRVGRHRGAMVYQGPTTVRVGDTNTGPSVQTATVWPSGKYAGAGRL